MDPTPSGESEARDWLTARAGLGWIGKNTLLLHAERGSLTLLAVLLTTIEVPVDSPGVDQCGSCRLCLDSCPTGAFPEPYVLDARKCLSYLTIEERGAWPAELRAAAGDHVFGCDVCQDVCPWNLRPLATLDPGFGDAATPVHEPLAGLLALDAEQFADFARGRPLARPGRDGLVRNACIAAGNSGATELVAQLTALLADPALVVRDAAAWALNAVRSRASP